MTALRLPKFRPLFAMFAVLLVMGMGDPQVTAASAAEPTLKRVMLSTGGVGYFEFEATVTNDESLQLAVRLDQVDDVLKSVVIYDDAGGVGTIRLPSKAPLEEIFRDLPFGPDALVSLGRVLESLKGAEISVEGPRSMTGRIASVMMETTTDDGNVQTQHRVALMTASGLQQFILEDADNISFVDSTLDAQIKDALARVSERSAQNRRTLVIESQGNGVRTLTIGYVVEVPLWKSSYRLILPPITEEEDNLTARLQGWSVLENTSGQDWDDVELTILSGNPVTFRQALYATYYVDRPEVPVEVLGRVLPDPDTGEITERGLKQVGRLDENLRGAAGALEPGFERRAEELDAFADSSSEAMSIMVTSRKRAAVSAESATQVVFRLAELVNVRDGESLVVPIIDRTVPAERVSHFVARSSGLNPLAAVKLLNDSDTGLPPGVLTIYEIADDRGMARTAYLGDGRLGILPKGEERVIAFALDEKVQVSSDYESEEQVTTAKIVNGVLERTTIREATTKYTVKAPAEEDRVLLLDHPQNGGELVSPEGADVSKTTDAFRIREALKAGQTNVISVVVQWPEQETITLINVDYRTLFAYANNKRLDDATRQAFSRLSQLRSAVDAQDRRIKETETQRNNIFQGQERIRENIKALPENSSIQSRYLRMLDAQEDELEQIAANESTAKSARAQAWQALRDYIESL